MTLYYKQRAVKSARRIFPKVVIKNLREFPFPNIVPTETLSNCAQIVRKRLALAKSLARIKTAHERTALTRQIEATDREIDAIVYELYGLSDQEIRLVEEATAR